MTMVVHAARQSGNQQFAVGHPDKTIQARQLLGGIVSGPLPSIIGGIPVLGPVLGGGQSPPPPAPGPPPPPPPSTPVHSSSPPSSTAPPNGGGSHSGSSGGSSSGSGSSSKGSSSGGSKSGGSKSGSSGSGTTTAGAPQNPSPTTGSGSSTEISQPNSVPSADPGSILSGNQSNNSSSSSASSTVSSGSQAVPKYVPLPDTIQSSGAPAIHSSPSGVAPNNPSSTDSTTTGVGNNNGSNALADNKHSISPGGIAAIVVVLVLLFLLAIVLILRRRSKMRRDERKHKWWFATNRTSQTYGDLMGEEIMPSGTRTARSSFVTTVDHSAHTGYAIPPFPPAMAEVGRGNGARPALIINTYDDSTDKNATLFNFEETRFSIGSASSDHSQYLIVQNRNSGNPDLQGGHTPMSVRPFSPSESFAFPKPPEPAAGSASGSRPSSSAASAVLSTASLAVTPLPDLPDIPTFPLTVPLTAVSTNTNSSSPTNTVVGRTSDPFSDNNPFEDPVSSNTTIVHSTASFSEVEIVRRPFVPSLPDELAVKPDDTVRVLHSFDDGWALVETVPQGYYHGGDSEKGLIPIDCLRKPGQNLPAFLASKRVSSYGEQFLAY